MAVAMVERGSANLTRDPGATISCTKPDPAIYRDCLARMQVRPEHALFVGDGGSDELRGARDVGLTTVFVTGMVPELDQSEFAYRKGVAEYTIDSLERLVLTRSAKPLTLSGAVTR